MSRIILKGDTHGNAVQLETFLEWNEDNLTEDDIVIVLGDFGIIWQDKEETTKVLEILGNHKCQLAFLDGNHENFNLIKEMETIIYWNGGRAGLLPGGILHLLRGEIYNIDNKRIGVCGGANSVDKYRRTEGISWWADEEITKEDVDNLLAKTVDNNHLDMMLTHDCPAKMTKQVALFSGVNGVEISNSQKMLDIIDNALKIDKWYFGHWHINMKFDDKFECLYHNFKEV